MQRPRRERPFPYPICIPGRPGLYTITAYARDEETGATGVDPTTLVLREGD